MVYELVFIRFSHWSKYMQTYKKKVDLFVNLALTNTKTQNLENEIKLLDVCLGGK